VARFYAPALEPADVTVALPDDEAQHLVRVLRLEPGADVRVFNGRGYECGAVVELAGKRGVVLRVVGPEPAAPELPFALTLAQAVLKGDKMDDLVRDAVMLGVSAIRPLQTRHIDVPQAQLARGRKTERWQRIAVSSSKQCGRAVVPAVAEPTTFLEVLREPHDELRVMLVEPRAATDARPLRELTRADTPRAITVFAGPEGGWSADELDAAHASGARLVTLGPRVLRADAIALVALPVLLYVFGALD
jgi:16S rRNA (uracil1498-N3)-methyltransferase